MTDRPLTTREGNTAVGDRLARVIKLGWPLAYREDVRDEALAALDELRAECERLRAALERIADRPFPDDPWAREMRAIARVALGEADND